MRKIVLAAVVVFSFALSGSAQAGSVSLLQVHNPTGGNPANPEPADVKSQFIMVNDSTSGILIDSILWEFANPLFIDSALGGDGYGGYRDYQVSPGQTYGGVGPGEFQTTVQEHSDDLTGYIGPQFFLDGSKSLFLTFDDFDPTEAFGFWTDLDTMPPVGNSTGRVGNSDFNGTVTTISFSDGTVAKYTWQLPDNTGRSFYAQGITGGDPGTNAVPEPATMMLMSSGLMAASFFRRKVKS